MTASATTAARSTVATPSIAGVLVRTLTWPVIALMISGGVHFTLEATWPDLKATFVPAVLGPLLLAYGAWTGLRAVTNGGNFLTAMVAGAILGLFPLMLNVVGFGVILGRGTTAGVLAGIFGWAFVFFGSMLGGGFALSDPEGRA
jgi:hypothetical protein